MKCLLSLDKSSSEQVRQGTFLFGSNDFDVIFLSNIEIKLPKDVDNFVRIY